MLYTKIGELWTTKKSGLSSTNDGPGLTGNNLYVIIIITTQMITLVLGDSLTMVSMVDFKLVGNHCLDG